MIFDIHWLKKDEDGCLVFCVGSMSLGFQVRINALFQLHINLSFINKKCQQKSCMIGLDIVLHRYDELIIP